MADVSSTNEDDWDSEQSECPPEGSIFLLRLSPDYAATTVADSGKYQLTIRNGNHLTMLAWLANKWSPGHTWDLKYKPTFRLLLGGWSLPTFDRSGTLGPAVNDYVCKTCKNSRCSRTEKTCWLCGNPLN